MLPETKVKIPSATTDIAEVPAASPSMPSVKLAPFDTAVIINGKLASSLPEFDTLVAKSMQDKA